MKRDTAMVFNPLALSQGYFGNTLLGKNGIWNTNVPLPIHVHKRYKTEVVRK
jgi:5-keto 4-deoxyuronate isomerase